MSNNSLMQNLELGLRAEFGIEELSYEKSIASQIPQGMDKIDQVMIKVVAESVKGSDISEEITGEETISELYDIITKK